MFRRLSAGVLVLGLTAIPAAAYQINGVYARLVSCDWGWSAVENIVHVHDLHATMLKLCGIDHMRLTVRYQGRDFRLTDVHGNVVRELLA